MDPTTIIDITHAVLSFVEFTGKVILTAIEIRNIQGVTKDKRYFKYTVHDF